MPKVIDKATIKMAARISLGRHRNGPPNGGTPNARTPLGRELLRLRGRIVRSGEPLLSAAAIRREISKRWGS